MAEDLAGIVLAAAAGALLLRHTVVIYRHQELGVPLQTDDRELAQGNIDPLSVIAEAQVAAEAGANARRDFGQFTVAGAALADVHQLHIEHDGVYRLHHGGGQVGFADVLLIHPLKRHLGGEHLGGALAAEENHPLVKDTQAADLHRPGSADERVRSHAVVVADIHSVEAPVKADGFHINVHVQQLRLARLDADGAVDHRLAVLGGVKAQILDTILVFARIIDLLRVYAHGLADTGSILHRTGHDLLRHCNTS